MPKEKVYLETSVISYLTARPSRDVVKLAKQELTRQWWEKNREEYDMYISTPVRDEAGKGDKDAVRRHMEAGDDPIVEELRRIRWRICKKAGGTPADYVRYYYEMDKKIFGESTAAEAAKPARTKAKPRRKSAKPAAKASARKPRQRRKAVTA